MKTRTVIFFDSSALAKRYIAEQGSRYVEQYFTTPANSVRIFVSALTYIEVIAAISRRVPALPATLTKAFIADYQQGMQRIPVDRAIIEHAALLCQIYHLRAADAIQLASAMRVAQKTPDVLLVTADLEMINAAQTEGLQVENPNRYN
jgi:predicted nucleic acid-binding protein